MRTLTFSLLALLLSVPGAAQSSPQTPPPAGGGVLQAGAQLAVVDVVVEDSAGRPVVGLKPEDFTLLEDGRPQALQRVEAHAAQTPVPRAAELPKLPPGTFTDYTSAAASGTLNILLLDALNTPMADRGFYRRQLQEYVQHADSSVPLAIFGLANRLVVLQDFDSDPATLKDVVDHKLIRRGPSQIDDPGSGEAAGGGLDTGPGVAQIAANLQQFEAGSSAIQIRLRAQYTLDAFNTLAHYLAALPGRKNLIWLAGAFPLDVRLAPGLNGPLPTTDLDAQEYRETIRLLSRARVAVYPIDARALMTPLVPSGAKVARKPQRPGPVSSVDASQAAERSTMQTLAEDTGGHAYFSTDDLAATVADAVRAGAAYYTLTYIPTRPGHEGGYREIRVSLTAAKDTGLQLVYRHRYDNEASSQVANAATRAAYVHAAMARGAPAPEALLFKVRVLPASSGTETAAAADNQLDPFVPASGPFRRYAIDFAALTGELTLTLQPDGRRAGQVQCLVYVYNRDGRLLNTTGRSTTMNLKPATYELFLQRALQCHLEVSVPEHAETYLRIGLQDVPSNRFGVIEIPAATVSRLPPLAPANAVPATPSKSTMPLPLPSTPPEPTASQPH